MPPSAFALLNIDGTRNQVFVFGNLTFAYDSNIFSAAKDESGDYIYSATVGLELKRRAGIIAVNAKAVFDRQEFQKNKTQSAWNPTFYLEFNKTTGRTTGAFTINAFRSSRADSAVNLRTQTWNFPLGLNVKYPINDKFYVTSTSGYLKRSYTDGSGLLNYTDYSEGLDLLYVFTSKSDLSLSYRIRVGQTTLDTTTDQSLMFGLVNQIIPKVNGAVRVGLQRRTIDKTGTSFSQITVASDVTWTVTRKLNVKGVAMRDFSTTAVGGSVDSITGQLNAAYDFSRKYQANGGLGYGRNRFLDGTTQGRRDEFFTWDVGFSVNWSEHLRASFSYNYLHNWSTLSYSDFERTGYSLDISSRY
ncbi:outer membrane beta-barrel protein [Oleiharenicola sp. Vm1]|uniref:outer membrane beta-barrel protein n=1 Tax=Oleiharenicola sp. Vm1 TaxID=3398393 RepID=UPI0039F49366